MCIVQRTHVINTIFIHVCTLLIVIIVVKYLHHVFDSLSVVLESSRVPFNSVHFIYKNTFKIKKKYRRKNISITTRL